MSARSITRREALAISGCTAALVGLTACDAFDSAPQGDRERPIIVDKSAAEPEPEPEPKPELDPAERIEEIIAGMTLEEKAAQLFMVTPEQLTGVSTATVAGSATKAALETYPVGGLVYFSKNITGTRQVRDLLANTAELARNAGAGIVPFLGVDEEGGPLVARVANSGLFDVAHFPNMADIGATGDAEQAAEVGRAIGTYLHDIGFNLNFAPVADVLTNPNNTVIGPRSFGSDPALVAQMVAAEVGAMLGTETLPCVKHFPGHGDTAGDSHTGAVTTARSRDEIESCELEPFRAAIEAGCPFVMVGHIETPNFAGDGLPASLSSFMMTDILRDELHFDGVIVSDSFAMGAITEYYAPADAALRFFQAGGDLLLMTTDLAAAHRGVVDAMASNELPQERVDESLRRILSAKERAGLLR